LEDFEEEKNTLEVTALLWFQPGFHDEKMDNNLFEG
jgi:hypothetical protein